MKCHRCGSPTPIDELDAKPPLTPRLRAIRLVRGQSHMLGYAAEHGYDFTVLECSKCYGPGYERLST